MKDLYRKQFRSYWPFRGIAATALLMVAAGAAQEPESRRPRRVVQTRIRKRPCLRLT